MNDNTSSPQGIYSLFEQFGSIHKIEKNRPVFQEGERSEDVYLIQSGSVRITKDTESGQVLTIRIAGPNSFIGETSVFCEVIYHSVSAHTNEPTHVLVIPRNLLEKLLSASSLLIMEWMKVIQTHNLKNETRFRDLLLHGKKGALYSTLIRLSNTYGVEQMDGSIIIDYTLTNQALANFCATSREVVNRMLNDLKKLCIISFDKGIITIHDLQFLRTEVECDNCPLHICRID
ncbi:Crp/Fnr family transcriptional regulator [Psychrobacillus soli]|uniref:Crp/Fnr family transcriptional regulator n=1 Tax=Psychrobacillus soli TaxID=1543965 RepID=A0A544TJG4_9BACI|nr:Crp/Fnr family transcriptional regulator [Psychrobacillus soli]TQR17597.1 Crp/Fnr family transcriptional regulator [Psychrobacillus soli]